MSINTTENKMQLMPEFLRQAINREVEEATKIELEEAQKRIEKRKSEIIAGVVLHIEKIMQIETVAEKLIITVIQK